MLLHFQSYMFIPHVKNLNTEVQWNLSLGDMLISQQGPYMTGVPSFGLRIQHIPDTSPIALCMLPVA